MDEMAADSGPGPALSLPQTRLRVKDIMNQEVVTASASENICTATRRMCQNDVSCLVVVDAAAVVGVLTQKDLLAAVAQEEKGYNQLPVAERMSSPTIVAPPDLPVLEAGRILKAKRIKHLPIVADDRLVGIVTQTDITRGLVYLMPLQRVSEVMSPNIATVDLDATAAEAARTMWARNITGVVVMHSDQAVGIVSQKDILVRVMSVQKNADCAPVVDVMSTPVLPIPPSHSVFRASRMMARMHIHRLVVQDGRRVYGIISQTDILQAIERRLEEEEEQRLLLACSEIPMFILDAQSIITYVNAAFLKVFAVTDSKHAVGKDLSDARFWHSDKDRQRVCQFLQRGEPGLLRAAVKTNDGERKRIVLLLTATRNACDEVHSWQGVLWDATSHRLGRQSASEHLHSTP
jgi:CBS domain-containing protein